ncbi:MAG: HEAT repeat domain-containing protein, partial [Myxococcota bacterium]
MGTPGAAGALLRRFKVKVDPSITDNEEKQMAFDGIVAIGRGEKGKRVEDEGKDGKEISSAALTDEEVAALRDAVVAHCKAYCARAENLTWPLKVIRALHDDAGYEREVLSLLSQHDTEYTRNVEPTVNLLAALEGLASETVRQAVEAYLEDQDETVRFHAVQTLFTIGDGQSLAPLISMMAEEESVRIKNKVCDGIVAADWSAPEELRPVMAQAMNDVYEYRLDVDSGRVTRA